MALHLENKTKVAVCLFVCFTSTYHKFFHSLRSAWVTWSYLLKNSEYNRANISLEFITYFSEQQIERKIWSLYDRIRSMSNIFSNNTHMDS